MVNPNPARQADKITKKSKIKLNNMKAMFNGISQLTDTSALNDWDILNTSNFTNMFLNCPSHPEFTKRPGTWDGNGTFIPSA